MSKKTESHTPLQLSGDDILDELAIGASPVIDMCDESENHSVLVIGVRLNDEDEENPSVNTFMAASGYLEILAEGLYSELADQMSKGDTALFSILRDTIRSLENELGILPDEELDQDNDGVPYILH